MIKLSEKKKKVNTRVNLLSVVWKASLSILLIYLVYSFLTLRKVTLDEKTISTPLPSPTVVADKTKYWLDYKDEAFNYIVKYPTTLKVNDLGVAGGYIKFIRFEENLTPNQKGFALGVSQLTLIRETARIKNAFLKEGSATLAEETDMTFKDLPAKRLFYKPSDLTQKLESRVIVIFNKGRFTYSVSSVPEEIDTYLKGFEFINK